MMMSQGRLLTNVNSTIDDNVTFFDNVNDEVGSGGDDVSSGDIDTELSAEEELEEGYRYPVQLYPLHPAHILFFAITLGAILYVLFMKHQDRLERLRMLDPEFQCRQRQQEEEEEQRLAELELQFQKQQEELFKSFIQQYKLSK